MSTYIQSKAFSQISKNGKVLKKSGYDAMYDGDKAIIDTMNNDKFVRVELENDELIYLLKKFMKSNSRNSKSVKDILMRDFNINKESLVKDMYKNNKQSRSIVTPLFSDNQTTTKVKEKTQKRHKHKQQKKEQTRRRGQKNKKRGK